MTSEKAIMAVLLILVTIGTVAGVVYIFKAPSAKESTAADVDKKLSGIFSGMVAKKDGVGIVKVYGPIQTETERNIFDLPIGGADYVIKRFEKLRKNDKVKAIVLRVNSPGGTVGASQEILEQVVKAREDGKKVVVSMGDMAASGGYYISCKADKIFANPGTITGSIGVFIGGLDLTGLGEKIGVGMNVIKSGKYKDVLNPWREMTEEERTLLQETVDSVYDQFLNAVAEGRGIPKEELRAFADGRIMTGAEAMEYNLVDELGSFKDAVKAAYQMAGLEGEPYIVEDKLSDLETFFEFFNISTSKKPATASDFLFGTNNTSSYLPVTYLYPGYLK